jgi:hypothetical protein
MMLSLMILQAFSLCCSLLDFLLYHVLLSLVVPLGPKPRTGVVSLKPNMSYLLMVNLMAMYCAIFSMTGRDHFKNLRMLEAMLAQ